MSTTAPRASARSAPDATDGLDVSRLAEALTRVTRATRRELALPLGASSLAALATVDQQGPMRLGDLARHEGVTPATLSRIVSVLEDDGYARRTVDADDRRSSWLEVTPAGKRLLAGVRRDRAALVAARVARLSTAQRRALANALDGLEALSED
jgi:DNA-binding MarR family transcriptional regulator